MDLRKAIHILELHNKWRRDRNVPSTYEMAHPRELGEAIDKVVGHIKVQLYSPITDQKK